MMSSMEAIRAIIKDEMLQLLATGVVALLIVGVSLGVDGYVVKILGAAANANYATPASALDAANTAISGLGSETTTVLNALGDVSLELGREASKGVFCNFLGVGFTIVNCSPLNAYRGSLTTAGFATSMALADTYAQQFILSLARAYAFTFLVPLGLFLRVFKLSRQAGGALIAVGFGFYTVFPTVILASEKLLHGPSPPSPAFGAGDSKLGLPSVGECNPSEPDISESLAQFRSFGSSLEDFGLVYDFAYFILVRVLFTSILNLIITLGFIRAFAHLLGSEIDVSGLARIS